MPSTGRILTTHTGSLPRPRALTKLHARRARGEAVDAQELAAASSAAVQAIIPKQRAAGIDIPNDGEQGRESFVLYLRDRLTGLGGSSARGGFQDIDAYPEFKAEMQAGLAGKEAASVTSNLPAAIGPVTYVGTAAMQAECAEFRAALGSPDAPGFMAAPSPGILAAVVQNQHYASDDAYLDALAHALRAEYGAILAAGFTLQIDCPDLALERHGAWQDKPLSAFLHFSERVVAAINRAIEGLPRQRIRLHVCWGNYEAPHDHDVPFEDIWPVIRQAQVGGFVLPFANPRHAHEHRVFRRMPLAEDQILVAGVIDTLTNFVEHPEVVAERLERIAESMGDPRRLMAGTDCGFDTSAGRGRVVAEVVWAKLRSMAEGARIASGRLLGPG
ncbi:cobalamin-independent methionine synthase II family protein [Sediminicoccus sp. KRV36]|uniref:cobalamin-independent methionine synthase II family protein n=1 Tax=Sediminicoccus sp. KRV36 TaxID=3133721 RepID=UPI002010425C|nr:cobalamin-independent methionine synthase II family protein [Sediminicoccus rosea]UPY38237.1 cobalamin-independent methionine synthase II family protein [Sediminicoccus rosea]